MKKLNRRKTHYEILDISMSASPFEINHAYREAFELYQDDNMAACAFFSDSERKELLCRLEKAYLTLISPGSRATYDRTLMEQGILDEERQFHDDSKGRIPVYNIQRKQLNYRWLPETPSVDKSIVSGNAVIQETLKREQLTGPDLKSIRTTLGVPLERIFLQTRITINTLEAIEEDRFECLPPEVYVKGFLKLYAQCLQIDSNTVIQAYMKHMKGDH